MATIVVCGAGPGLGSSVARRYGREGYVVVLVARNSEKLDALAQQLKADGIAAHPVPADLSDPSDMGELASRIREAGGDPDVLYYAPTSTDMAFVPAAELSAERQQAVQRLLVGSFIALIQEFLPHMIVQHSGAILTAQGATALSGTPGMSGPGPAMAAQRNYLQALGLELENKGVFVGRVYISSLIANSAIHRGLVASGKKIPKAALVSPDDLAERLWNMHHKGHPHEVVVPRWGRFFGSVMSTKLVRRAMARRAKGLEAPKG